ncbi:MAG: SDR family oxidoreductase [Candidatus Nitrohelix vancouverensis]|uniref:SDR family oxidoreductase n=1 Tax=Candidatus Nitrohelix vancouverensis TaxID=2705534 RepID=A0A7T0C092_9BACT|nr:MAG: SDR family oxidoreductase [Candidatus Nitrohelix vancouverensis]
MPTALITGGAVRIGRALVLHLANLGWDIALHYNRSESQANATLKEVKFLKRRGEAFACDLSDLEAVEQLTGQVLESFPDLELLINCASLFLNESVENTSRETLEKTLNINLSAPYILMRDYKRKVGKGMIVNILDERIKRNVPAFAAYSVSKVALSHLTHLAAVDWGSEVRVNAIAPGLILPPVGGDPGYLKRAAKNIPAQNHGDTEDIVRALQYLIESPFVNGETLFVDGGESKG